MKKQFRQGDVLIQEVDEILEGAKEIAREQGAVVLARGDATGHAHAIRAPGARFFESAERRFLRVVEYVPVLHEEHAAVDLPPGIYEVIRQREFVEEVRDVAD